MEESRTRKKMLVMKNLRSQMNDFEEQSASFSVEEEKQRSAIQSMEKDLSSLKSETESLEQSIVSMHKEKTQVICDVAEKTMKIASLEAESTTLSQTLELLQQESAVISEKLKEKRAYYAKVVEEMRAALQEQQDCFSSYEHNREVNNGKNDKPAKCSEDSNHMEGIMENVESETHSDFKLLMAQVESAQAIIAEYKMNKEKLSSEIAKEKINIELLKHRLDELPNGLKEMDVKELEKEHNAILSDKAGEQEYLQSIHDRIQELQGVSELVKCSCGEEYMV